MAKEKDVNLAVNKTDKPILWIAERRCLMRNKWYAQGAPYVQLPGMIGPNKHFKKADKVDPTTGKALPAISPLEASIMAMTEKELKNYLYVNYGVNMPQKKKDELLEMTLNLVRIGAPRKSQTQILTETEDEKGQPAVDTSVRVSDMTPDELEAMPVQELVLRATALGLLVTQPPDKQKVILDVIAKEKLISESLAQSL